MELEHQLLDNLFKLLFEKSFYVFGLSAINNFICKPEISDNVINVCMNDDICVFELEEDLDEALSFSFDIETEYQRYEEYKECSYDSDIDNDEEELIRVVKLILDYKYQKGIQFIVNIHHGPLTNLNLNFDFEGINVKNKNKLVINEALPDYTLCDAFNCITNKEFKIKQIFEIPKKSRKKMGIKTNSKLLLRYIEVSKQVATILNNGWTLKDQKLEDFFDPCLIAETNEEICNICQDTLNKYELELQCCKKIMCFNCATNHIDARSENSKIFCPFCKGDPFNLKTI